jgi:peroxiredoxin
MGYGKKKYSTEKNMGTERTTFLIDETGIIGKIYTKVKPQGHA